MNTSYPLILTASLSLLLGACANGQHTNRDEERAWKEQVDQQLASISEAMPAPADPDELAKLKARIGVLEAQGKRDAEEAESQMTEINSQMAALRRELKGLHSTIRKLKSQPQKQPDEKPAAKEAEQPRVESKSEPEPVVVSSSPKPASQKQEERAKRAYYDAYFALKNGDYFEATLAFRNFLRDFPETKLVGEARYWYAESLLAQGDKDTALQAFQEIVNASTASPRHAAAMLKAGLILEEQKRWDESVSLYNELLQKHPATSEAETARSRLKRHSGQG